MSHTDKQTQTSGGMLSLVRGFRRRAAGGGGFYSVRPMQIFMEQEQFDKV